MRVPWLLLLPLIACVRAPPGPAPEAPAPKAPASEAVPAPVSPCVHPGLVPDALLTGGQVIVLGEVHGTEASPQAVGEVACQSLALGRKTVLVLELPVEETALIEAFLAGGDREALLEGPFWRRDYQDGRSSLAMLRVLERARALRESGLPLSVLAMDVSQAGVDRDTHMAERVVTAHAGDPQSVFVVLVGNIHARPKLSLPRSMAWRVRKAGVPLTSLLLTYAEGTTWLCDVGGIESCGVHPLRGVDRGAAWVFTPLEASSPNGFDGELYVGPARASPPAISASGSSSSQGPASAPRR